ncbi:hypothetical protein Rm378p094 [Rhodothermus phage RM378]|uniref:hypothetical protein n=1 Tax=Rhodothermus phage RM378 TaxID=148943 RepID=UPI000018F65E|nr:hypothetical protein Rm378p094 [Rhodothermus phage RM378]
MKYWKEALLLILIAVNIHLYVNRTVYRPEVRVELSDRVFPSELKVEGKFAQPVKQIIYRETPVGKIDTVECPKPVDMKLYGLLPERYATWKGNTLRVTFFNPETGRFMQEDFALKVRKTHNLISASVGLNYYDFSFQKRFFGSIYGGVGVALVNGKVYPTLKLTVAY